MTSQSAKKALKCPNCGANVAEACVKCEFCHSVLTLTACPACFGSVFKGVKFCPDCGTAVDRGSAKQEKHLTCPRCEHVLTSAIIGNTKIDECNNCGGIWMDKESFQKICDDREQQEQALVYPSLIRTIELQPTNQPTRMYIPCPECGGLMQRKNFVGCSGIIVDWCKQHGTWFDRQELQQIVNFIKSGGLQKARKIELMKLEEEQRRLRNMQFDQNLDHLNMLDSMPHQHSYDEVSLSEVIFSICKKLF